MTTQNFGLDTVRLSTQEYQGVRIARVQLNRPDKLNALTLDTLSGLVSAAHAVRADRTIRAVILEGTGESFCAGLDFGTVLKTPTRVGAAFIPRPWRGTNTFQEACWAWRRLPVPVIAAIHGHCLGGGLQIALAADFRLSTPDATWSVLEGRWGLIPDMTGIHTLSQLVGIDHAKKLTMTGEKIDGTRATELGLVTSLAEDPSAAALDLATSLATRSPDSVAAAKRVVDRSWNSGPRRTFARERLEQALLLAVPNTARARSAALHGKVASYRPRVVR